MNARATSIFKDLNVTKHRWTICWCPWRQCP